MRHRARDVVVLDIPLLFEKGGWRKVGAIAVVSAPSGAPQLLLAGAADARARELGVVHTHLSLSHADGMAVAVVIFERLP